MTKPASARHGRGRDAQRAREVILDAAEAVFAEHGFDGARSDAIAKASGYNVSLLFQYFSDKRGLYTAVLKRADRELHALQERALAPLLVNEALASHEQGFRIFLKTVVHLTFDYLVEHPRFLRILTWEMAEGWHTYAQIVTQLLPEDTDSYERLFRQARDAGLLRSGLSPLIQLTLIFQTCQSYLAFLPLYQWLLPREEGASERALAAARAQLVAWISGAMLVDPPAPVPKP
jgi:TetR/AcrR family transcriptional regulator